MKSKAELEEGIKQLRVDLQYASEKKDRNKITNRIDFLKSCLYYLETNPTADFIQKQYDIVLKQLHIIDNGYAEWRKNQPPFKAVTQQTYKTEMNYSGLNKQKDTLDFLLH